MVRDVKLSYVFPIHMLGFKEDWINIIGNINLSFLQRGWKWDKFQIEDLSKHKLINNLVDAFNAGFKNISPNILEKLSGLKLQIYFYNGGRNILEVSKNIIKINAMAFENISKEELILIFNLFSIYISYILTGFDEKFVLKKCLEAYKKYDFKERKIVKFFLKRDDIDNIFFIFLENSLKGDVDRWITWLISQSRKKYAYDVERVRDILRKYGGDIYSTRCRNDLYRVIKQSYNDRLEEKNIVNLIKMARERGEDIVYMRLGRASMVIGYLLAASKSYKINEKFKNIVEDLLKFLSDNNLYEIYSPALRFKKILGDKWIPEAYFIRIRDMILRRLENYRGKVEKNLRKARDEGRLSGDQYIRKLDELNRLHLRINQFLEDISEAFYNSRYKYNAYVFFGQRISPMGASKIAYVNEILKAYAGPEFGLDKYIAEGGMNIHATPSLTALKYVDYWIEALPLFIHEIGEGRYEIDYENMETAIRMMAPYWAMNIENSLKEGRNPPTFIVVTTQSYNMTNLVKYWLEEEMANYNIVKAYGLEDEVKELVKKYRRNMIMYAKTAIEDMHYHEALKMELSKGFSEERALLNIILKDKDFRREVAKIALIKEYNLDKDVERYVKNGLSVIQAREKVLSEYGLDSSTLKLTKDSKIKLIDLTYRYIRDHIELALSTARKEVIAKHGLLKELDKYRYEAVGERKAYNLVYAPSRVDLGPHEIESVIAFGQPLGPFDLEAGRAAQKLFEKINISEEGAYIFPNPASAEGQKTLENASRDDNYAFANLIALSAEAMGANAYSIISYINMRPTHLILWPGRGYGGFCVPKDGLFVSYVLSLKSEDVLEKIGVPRYLHPYIINLVEELLSSRWDYEDVLEWQEMVEEKIKKVLKDFSTTGIYIDGVKNIIDIVSKLGSPVSPWKKYLRDIAKKLYEERYIPSRLVNNFMPYHTAALIYHALERARERNPNVHDFKEFSVGIQASYKPGVQDSRLSTEFELFLALTKSDERLNRMRWRWLREIVHKYLDKYDVPGEIRVIDPLIDVDSWLFDSSIRLKNGAEKIKMFLLENIPGISEDDIILNLEKFGVDFLEWIIGIDSNGGEIKIKDRPRIILNLSQKILMDFGLSKKDIEENFKKYGIAFSKWPQLKSIKNIDKIILNRVKGGIHWLNVYYRGIYKSFEEGIRGLDVLSLGIPHPNLVKFTENLVKLYFLMKDGNPSSALAIVDGSAGARGVVFDKDMVKSWLALGGTYVAIGISDEIIDYWLNEMNEEKNLAERLLNNIMSHSYAEAQKILNNIVGKIRDKIDEYNWLLEGMEIGSDAKEYSEYREKYKLILRVIGRCISGLNLADLDFGTFLILGGRYLLLNRVKNFRDFDEFKKYVYELWNRFDENIRFCPINLPDSPPIIGKLERKFVKEVVERLILREKVVEEKVERVLGGSLKGEMKEEWEVLQRRLIRRRQRIARIIEYMLPSFRERNFDKIYHDAKKMLESSGIDISDDIFSKLIIYMGNAITILTRELSRSIDEANRIYDFINQNIFRTGGIGIRNHKILVDHLARLASYANGDKGILEKIAMAAELLDISLAIELVSNATTWRERWTAIATFFDRTLNIHIFDYTPYLYMRATFSKDKNFNDVFTRKEMFELIERRHKWLYNYLRKVIENRTELKLWDKKDVEILLTLGTDRDDIALRDGYIEASKFVFKYARLRDLATLYHDGFFLPEVLDDVDPDALDYKNRVNVVILYNLGNTTAMTFLKRAPYHHENKGPDKNIIMTNFLRKSVDEKSGREIALIDYGLMFLTKNEYVRAGGRNKILKSILDSKLREKYKDIGDEGRFVFVKFKKPLVAHVVFPHFTHQWFLNQVLEKMGIPLNQTRVIDRLTYKKTVLPEMIKYYNNRVSPNERIQFMDQVNIYRDKLKSLDSSSRRRYVEDVLERFSEKHRKVIIKTSTESGGRGTIIALLKDIDGRRFNKNIRGFDGSIEIYGFNDALNFILNEILPKDDAVIQEFIESNPREILTEKAFEMIKRHFESLNIRIDEETPLYWNFRNYVTQVPGEEPQIVGWIMLIHVKGIANYGQGGQLFVLEREMFKEKYRYLIDEMERVSKATMKMMELYAPIFAEKEGIWVGRDATGTPYYIPMTNLSDLMLKPVYEKNEIIRWDVVPIEENIGMGLFYPYERQLKTKGREGESVDPILINLARVGEKYKEIIGK